jgi:VanZ family protein
MFLESNKWTLVWAAFIFVLHAIPGYDLPHISWLELLSFDKFVHVLLFFVFIILLARGFIRQDKFDILRSFPRICASLCSVSYGAVLELFQDLIFEQRTMDIYDFAADTLGCVLGMIFYMPVNRWKWLKYLD